MSKQTSCSLRRGEKRRKSSLLCAGVRHLVLRHTPHDRQWCHCFPARSRPSLALRVFRMNRLRHRPISIGGGILLAKDLPNRTTGPLPSLIFASHRPHSRSELLNSCRALEHYVPRTAVSRYIPLTVARASVSNEAPVSISVFFKACTVYIQGCYRQ